MTCITAMTLLAASAVPIRPEAQEQSAQEQLATKEQKPEAVRYAVKDLGPVPGAGFSYAPVITNSGFATGWVSPPDGPRHAVLWHNRLMVKDIGAEGPRGLNSEAFGVNERGQVAFQSETLDPDLNGEDFCGFTMLVGSNPSCPLCSGSDVPHVCRPFLWSKGVIERLPMLVDGNGLKGGNGAVNQINNREEVVGLAENNTLDSTCPPYDPALGQYQLFQVKPVMWAKGRVRELPIPFTGDPDGVSFGINDNGEAVGGSGTCTAFNAISQLYVNSVHALL
jgi:uncharacterized membrane protein